MDMNKVIKSILFGIAFFLLQAVCLIWFASDRFGHSEYIFQR